MSITRLPFEEVFADESGGNIKTPQSEYLREGLFPVVDQGKSLIAGYVDEKERVCGGGKPAIVFGDHTRCVKYIDHPFCMGADGVKVLRPKIDADLKYLYYYLKQLHLPDAGYDRHFKYLKRTEVVLFPLLEQRRIAAILDKADALRTKRREALAQLDRLAQSIFVEMFGDPEQHIRAGKVQELAQIVAPDRIVTYGIVQAGPEVANGVPYIKTGDIKGGEILVHQLARTSREIADSYSRSMILPGDIVMSIRATVGTTALVPSSLSGANLTQGTARISPSSDVLSEYLLNYLRTEAIQRWIQAQVKGATFREITLGKLRQLPVHVPRLSLQTEFERRTLQVKSLRKRQVGAFSQQNALFTSLQHRAFRGEL